MSGEQNANQASSVTNQGASVEGAQKGVSTADGPKGTAAPGYTNKTQVKSLNDLKEKAPEVHKAMMEGIAQTIIRKMRAGQERLKRIWAENRRQ